MRRRTTLKTSLQGTHLKVAPRPSNDIKDSDLGRAAAMSLGTALALPGLIYFLPVALFGLAAAAGLRDLAEASQNEKLRLLGRIPTRLRVLHMSGRLSHRVVVCEIEKREARSARVVVQQADPGEVPASRGPT
jgi:hypothetical protein